MIKDGPVVSRFKGQCTPQGHCYSVPHYLVEKAQTDHALWGRIIYCGCGKRQRTLGDIYHQKQDSLLVPRGINAGN